MELGRLFMRTGALLFVIGLVLHFKNFMPWIKYLGKLPGDIAIEKEGFQFYFPLMTCLLISVLASLVLWLLRRL
jgi:hypothetical protein